MNESLIEARERLRTLRAYIRFDEIVTKDYVNIGARRAKVVKQQRIS